MTVTNPARKLIARYPSPNHSKRSIGPYFSWNVSSNGFSSWSTVSMSSSACPPMFTVSVDSLRAAAGVSVFCRANCSCRGSDLRSVASSVSPSDDESVIAASSPPIASWPPPDHAAQVMGLVCFPTMGMVRRTARL